VDHFQTVGHLKRTVKQCGQKGGLSEPSQTPGLVSVITVVGRWSGQLPLACLMQIPKQTFHNHYLFSMSATVVTTLWLKPPTCAQCVKAMYGMEVWIQRTEVRRKAVYRSLVPYW